MRDQLIRYVDLLFAGAPEADDIKQEILQNTLDRYDDLVSQGKTPQAAYSLAIAGIGDVSELLGRHPEPTAQPSPAPAAPVKAEPRHVPAWKKALRAAAIFLYIISILPLIVLSELGMEVIGLCGTVSIVALATALIIIAGSGKSQPKPEEPAATPQQELRSAIRTAIFTVGLAGYLILSFATQAWYITWLIFPIIAAIQGIITACMDLKEANKHES